MKFHYGCLLSETGLRAQNGRDGRFVPSSILDNLGREPPGRFGAALQ